MAPSGGAAAAGAGENAARFYCFFHAAGEKTPPPGFQAAGCGFRVITQGAHDTPSALFWHGI